MEGSYETGNYGPVSEGCDLDHSSWSDSEDASTHGGLLHGALPVRYKMSFRVRSAPLTNARNLVSSSKVRALPASCSVEYQAGAKRK